MHLNHNIDLYISEGLPPRAEARLRGHLRTCDRCRAFYDRQVVVHRTLAGNPDLPTPQEEDRLVRLVLQNTGLQLPEPQPEDKPGLTGRILWAPIPAIAAAVFMLILGFAGLVYSLLQASPGEPVVAAHLTKGRNLEMDGAPVDARAPGELIVRAGVKLEVGPGGFADLSLKRGGSVRVFPESTLILSGPGELVELSSGKVWCLVDPVNVPFDIPFMVKTDVAEARAIGTSFVVERLHSGETDVRVAKGIVEVRDLASGEAVQIDGCYEARIVPGGSKPSPGRYSPKHDRSDWNSVLGEKEESY